MTDHAANKEKNAHNQLSNHKPDHQPNSSLDKQPSALKENASKPIIKMVDIVIAGTTYDIYCPVNEEEDLRTAVDHINNFALNLKKEAPNLSQENLLLLCCLNLYEKNNDKPHNDSAPSMQTNALLKKIINDAQSILG